MHIINYFSRSTESRISHRVRLCTVTFITQIQVCDYQIITLLTFPVYRVRFITLLHIINYCSCSTEYIIKHVNIMNYFSRSTESSISHRVRLCTVTFITHSMNYFSRSTQSRLSHRVRLSHHVHIINYFSRSTE